jgi:hypothetical protein
LALTFLGQQYVQSALTINLSCAHTYNDFNTSRKRYNLLDIFFLSSTPLFSSALTSILIHSTQLKYENNLVFHKSMVILGLLFHWISLFFYASDLKFAQILVSQILIGVSQSLITKGAHRVLVSAKGIQHTNMIVIKMGAYLAASVLLSVVLMYVAVGDGKEEVAK